MDVLEGARDTTKQFDIKNVAKNPVNFAEDRRVAQGLSSKQN